MIVSRPPPSFLLSQATGQPLRRSRACPTFSGGFVRVYWSAEQPSGRGRLFGFARGAWSASMDVSVLQVLHALLVAHSYIFIVSSATVIICILPYSLPSAATIASASSCSPVDGPPRPRRFLPRCLPQSILGAIGLAAPPSHSPLRPTTSLCQESPLLFPTQDYVQPRTPRTYKPQPLNRPHPCLLPNASQTTSSGQPRC